LVGPDKVEEEGGRQTRGCKIRQKKWGTRRTWLTLNTKMPKSQEMELLSNIKELTIDTHTKHMGESQGVYIHIYIYIYIYVYTHTHTHIYTYIYKVREARCPHPQKNGIILYDSIHMKF